MTYGADTGVCSSTLPSLLYSLGAGIARWQCVGLDVLLDAGSRVPSSSEEIFFPVEGIFSLELTWVLTPPPPLPNLVDECKSRSSLCTHAFPSHGSKRS